MLKTSSLSFGFVVTLFVVTSGIASAEVIYLNDFGTDAQKTVGGAGEWDSKVETPRPPLAGGYVPTVTILDFPNGWNAISQDLDGDGLHGGMSLDGWGRVRWIKKIDAAQGMGLSDISLTIHGHAAAYQQCEMSVALSDDGTTWDYTDTKIASWANYPDNTLTVSSGSDADYTNASSVWIAIEWYNGTNRIGEPWYSAYITDVKVDATVAPIPEPMTMSLLGLGGMFVLARRKRK